MSRQTGTASDPTEAFERLHGVLATVEALAQAAANALEFAPRGATAERRRAGNRLFELVTIVAERASAALDEADELARAIVVAPRARRRRS